MEKTRVLDAKCGLQYSGVNDMKKLFVSLLSLSILLNIVLATGWFVTVHTPPNIPEEVRDPVLASLSIVHGDLEKYQANKSESLIQDAAWRLNYASGLVFANSVQRNNSDLQVLSATLSGIGVWLGQGRHIKEVTKDMNIFKKFLLNDNSAVASKLRSDESFFEHQARLALSQIPLADKQDEP
jgi:hypothetical protein